MPEQTTEAMAPKRRWIAITLAVVIPAVLAYTFWRTTPTVGGWGRYVAAGDAGEAAAVDYSQNGRMPVGAAADPGVLYMQNCAACHGQTLGGGRVGPALKYPGWPYGKNRDLLVKIIHQGRGLTMPGYEGRLSNQQIDAIADWLQAQNGVGK